MDPLFTVKSGRATQGRLRPDAAPNSARADQGTGETAQEGQDLALDILTVNHRPWALYQRRGMTGGARHGDGNIEITMQVTRRAGKTA
jgi:hypothetical protein